jgi:hypothetical protein
MGLGGIATGSLFDIAYSGPAHSCPRPSAYFIFGLL